MKNLGIYILFLLAGIGTLKAQQTDEEYRQVMYGRADKIVKTLAIEDTAVSHFMTDLIAAQYIELGKINDSFNADTKSIKAASLAKEEQEKQLDARFRVQQSALYARHIYFVSNLYARLTLEQVELVKDGMTMGVYSWTYQGFLDMIPSLNEEEKAYIRAALQEAREYAMDCSDSKAKHAWFGKYKGRINNYLSKRGYDLQKERDAWYERTGQAKQQK